MGTKVFQYLRTSVVVWAVSLSLMAALLYTPFFEYGNYDYAGPSYSVDDDSNERMYKFTSDVYPIPFTDMYNVRVEGRGWCFLKVSRITDNVVFPRDKYFDLNSYTDKYRQGHITIYRRRQDYGIIPYALLFSTLLGLLTFGVLYLMNKIQELYKSIKWGNKEETIYEEYELLRK